MKITRFYCVALCVAVASVLCGTVANAQSTLNPTWSVQYMIDQSQTVLGNSQFANPRDNRGLAISPDGRYLYAGYNSGTEVRKIDLTQTDYTQATVARTTVSRGKAIAVDDLGRVYLAEGNSIKIMDSNLSSVLYTITTGFTCEGVAVTRENGRVVVYNTERGGSNKLTRYELTEINGAISASKRGLTGSGECIIAGAKDMRGVAVDAQGRIWIADPFANTNPNGGYVFRINSDGTGQVTTSGVENPYAIGFLGDSVLVTGGYRTALSTMNLDGALTGSIAIPWGNLSLQPSNGMISGIAISPNGSGFYITNEGGQTPGEKSTYGVVDSQSGYGTDGQFYTDLTHDDNDPILFASVPEPSSLIALFSGAAGLCGFALRRRK